MIMINSQNSRGLSIWFVSKSYVSIQFQGEIFAHPFLFTDSLNYTQSSRQLGRPVKVYDSD